MSVLDTTADRQAEWSVTANALKATVDRARLASFCCSIGGALAAALSTQIEAYKLPLAIIGAVALTVAAFLTSQFLTKDALSRHVRARAAAEALKREAFLHATNTGAHGDPAMKDRSLLEMLQKIDDELGDLSRYVVKAGGPGSCPRNSMTRDEYVKGRVDGQIAFYRKRAGEYGRWSKYLHTMEWVFALAAAVLTAVSGVTDKRPFDWASITAVLTTIAGAVLAHLQSSRFDELITSYLGTARRLENAKNRLLLGPGAQDFVQDCEDIIAAETKSWQAMWSKN
jgi:SMODS and SLOG-associating 2TM effector domain 1/Protein of unknown function (DUF4231)